MIVPAQVKTGEQIPGEARCAIVAFLEAPQKVAMRPGTNQQMLLLTSEGAASPLFHALIRLQVFGQEMIVPAGDREGGHGDALIKLLRHQRLPIRIGDWVCQPVEVVRRPALQQGQIDERKPFVQSREITIRLHHLL